jgi:hypothetical protein
MQDNSWLPWAAIVVSCFGGGLAGAVLTQIVQWRTRRHERPILIAEFGKEGDGSLVRQDLLTSNSDSLVEITRQWTRVKIRNAGRSTARNVRVIITSIGNKTSDLTEWKFDQEVIDCGWSHIDETKIDIPPQTWRFADIFVLDMTETKSDLKFTGKGATNIPGRIEMLSIEAKITADNSDTTTVMLPLRYKGMRAGMIFEKPA